LTRNNIAHWQYWQSAAGTHTCIIQSNLIDELPRNERPVPTTSPAVTSST
jgi:hypothetical protein